MFPLFNGKDLTGWEHVGPGRFVVEDGLLKSEGGMGLLWYTPMKIGYATIRIVYRTQGTHANSGVFIRIPQRPTEPWMPVNRGYEVQIDNAADDYHTSGVLYSHKAVSFSFFDKVFRAGALSLGRGWAREARAR
jgi:Domain of Unknown Function (DUF1080)